MSNCKHEESLCSCGIQDLCQSEHSVNRHARRKLAQLWNAGLVRASIVSIDTNEESLCSCREQESCQSEGPWGMSEVSLVTFSTGWKWTPEA